MVDLTTNDNDNEVSAILCDIEGTTTSISFVHDVLFPYARKHVETYLRANWNSEDGKNSVAELRKQAELDISNGVEGFKPILPDKESSESEISEDVLQSLLENIFWQMDIDRKIASLKSLQGKVWKFGYETGELKGHVYEDVPLAFRRWTEGGKKIFIYSSGSIPAQILLFSHSEAGDLCQYLSEYFDTTTGFKNESSSYTAIANKIGLPPNRILFLTDISAEAHASRTAGMQVRLLLRPGNKPLLESDLQIFQTAQNFDDIIM